MTALIDDALTSGNKKHDRSSCPHPGRKRLEATVAQFKKPGDTVAVDVLCELETDKVTVEVPSPVAGTLTEIVANEGDTVGVDALLAQVPRAGARRAGRSGPGGKSTRRCRRVGRLWSPHWAIRDRSDRIHVVQKGRRHGRAGRNAV